MGSAEQNARLANSTATPVCHAEVVCHIVHIAHSTAVWSAIKATTITMVYVCNSAQLAHMQ